MIHRRNTRGEAYPQEKIPRYPDWAQLRGFTPKANFYVTIYGTHLVSWVVRELEPHWLTGQLSWAPISAEDVFFDEIRSYNFVDMRSAEAAQVACDACHHRIIHALPDVLMEELL